MAFAGLVLGETDPNAYGFAFNGVSSNRASADFQFQGQNSDLTLSLIGFDIDNNTEISVFVNDQPIGFLSTTPNNQTGASVLLISAVTQINGTNSLTFVQKVPGWSWGITELVITSGYSEDSFDNFLELDVTESREFGFAFNGVSSNRASADFQFQGQNSDLTLSLIGFDIDNNTEISVFVNDQPIGFLSTTPNNQTGASVLLISADTQINGTNSLTFVQKVPGWSWGITELVITSGYSEDSFDNFLELDVTESREFGFAFNGVSSNRASADFQFQGQNSDLTLSLIGFDIDNNTEISVFVNDQPIGFLSTTPNNQTGASVLLISAVTQINGTNSLTFVQKVPGWSWGITELVITSGYSEDSFDNFLELDVTESREFGFAFNGVSSNRASADFQFQGQNSDLTLSLIGFDIDNNTEISVFVNDQPIGFLSTTPNNQTGASVLLISADTQINGTNSLTFVQKVPGWSWGITELILQKSNFPTNTFDFSNYQLAFSDEFNAPAGSGLDPTKWDTGLLWGPYFPINNEEQLYVDTLGMHSGFSHSPFEFTGSTLRITATPTSGSLQPPPRPAEDSPAWQPRSYSEYRYNGPYTDPDTGISYPGYEADNVNYLSGIITSYESLKMTHGYVEMRAKLPPGKGLWPAFWLLNTHYVEDVPEIDVMEFLGQDVDRLYHTYHYFDIADNWRKISTPSYPTYATDWTQDFHTFGMAWGPTEIIWYVDGVETRRITDSDYKIAGQAMYLIANLAVGGNWPTAPDDPADFPATFEIDYIRAYERKLSPELDLAADYQLMFEDNFNGSSLNPDKWNTHFLWGPYLPINDEEQYYVDALGSDNPTAANTPFVMNNGILSITARPADHPDSYPIPQSLPGLNDPIWSSYPSFSRNEAYTATDYNYTSGIITSYDAFKFVQGYAEIRARIPEGNGLWPAFWLLNGYYVNQQPEIDVMEARGRVPNEIVHSYHRLEGGINISESNTTVSSAPYSDNFHTYGVRWQAGKIDWYIDGNVVHTYENPDVAYQLMYVLANLAVGGKFDPGVPVDSSKLPASLDIDYIRVYQARHKD